MPARTNPTKLVQAIRIALEEVPFRSKSSQDDWALTIKLWASKCEEYPPWAVQKAADWWASGARDGDRLSIFLRGTQQAVPATLLEFLGLEERRVYVHKSAPPVRD